MTSRLRIPLDDVDDDVIEFSLDHAVFDTAKACVEFLTAQGSDGRVYRGEPRPYPKTCPGTRRVLEDKALHFQEQAYWIDLAGHFEDWFHEETGGSLDTAQMFLQHYGIPTDLLDFSSDPEIAVFFAMLAYPGDLGLICSMEIAKARKVCDIFNLSEFSLLSGLDLKRPQRQKAYAWRHQPGVPSDLKSDVARRLFGLRWYAFNKNEGAEYLAAHKGVLHADDDKVALYVISYAAAFGLGTWQQADIGLAALRRILKQMILSSD